MSAVSSQSGFVTAAECTICKAKKKCGVSRDGRAALCWKKPSNKQAKNGAYFHWLVDRTENSFYPATKRHSFSSSNAAIPKPKPKMDRPFLQFRETSIRHKAKLERHAQKRGVTVESLVKLGAIPEANSIVFPEQSPEPPFNVCGTNERFWQPIQHPDGTEQRFKFTGNRGFQLGPTTSSIPMLLIVEGGFDVASAIDAGFMAVGRCTRAADLAPLKPFLKDLSAKVRVVAICENDEAKPGLETPYQEVRRRTDELQVGLGRPVLVASPPPEHKDINDWWNALTEGKGHELSEKKRVALGQQMHDYLLRSAQAEIVAENKTRFETELRNISHRAESERHDRRIGGPDMDYDTKGSCACSLTLKRDADEGKTDFLGAKLACKSWRCSACRRRILGPDWYFAICDAFQDSLGVYYKWCHESDLAKIKRDLRKTSGDETPGKWVVIRTRATEPEQGESLGENKDFLVIADRPIRRGCCYSDFLDNEQNVDHFLSLVSRAIECVAYQESSHPITSSRGIRKTKKASLDDWKDKIRKICKSKEEVHAGYVTEAELKELRSVACRTRNVIGRKQMDFVTIETGDKHFAICSEEFGNCGINRNAISAEANSLIDSKGILVIRSSPCWTAKPTKGWEQTGIRGGASDVRIAAMNLKLQSRNVDFGALSPVVDAASVRVENSKTDFFESEIKKCVSK